MVANCHTQRCDCPASINAVASLPPFCSLASFHNDGDVYCWRTTTNSIDGAAISACELFSYFVYSERLHALTSKHFLASLCSQKSLNELMALWFESESHVDIPVTNFSLPFASMDLNTTEPDIIDEVFIFTHSLNCVTWICFVL
jgi:hypothetical protein